MVGCTDCQVLRCSQGCWEQNAIEEYNNYLNWLNLEGLEMMDEEESLWVEPDEPREVTGMIKVAIEEIRKGYLPF